MRIFAQGLSYRSTSTLITIVGVNFRNPVFMANKLLHMFAALAIGLLSTCPATAAELAGTYAGTFVCNATEYTWLLVLQPPEGKRITGETVFTRPGPAGDESGRHRVKGQFDADRSV